MSAYLILDTSTFYSYVALYQKSVSESIVVEPLSKENDENKSPRNEDLLIILDHILSTCNINKKMISGIFYVAGPGSFTGMRIGLSLVKSLAMAWNKSVYYLSTLDYLSAISQLRFIKIKKKYLVSVLITKKKTLFANFYQLNDKSIYAESINHTQEYDQEEFFSYFYQDNYTLEDHSSIFSDQILKIIQDGDLSISLMNCRKNESNEILRKISPLSNTILIDPYYPNQKEVKQLFNISSKDSFFEKNCLKTLEDLFRFTPFYATPSYAEINFNKE